MVFPDPYPSPPEPNAFSPLPDVPKEDDWMATWAQVPEYNHPELVDSTNFDFVSLDALFPWQQSGTLPNPTPDSQLGADLVSIFVPTTKLTDICRRGLTG